MARKNLKKNSDLISRDKQDSIKDVEEDKADDADEKEEEEEVSKVNDQVAKTKISHKVGVDLAKTI